MPAQMLDVGNDRSHVLVENHGDDELKLKWENFWHIVPAGASLLKPVDAVALWFGDWRLQDHPTDRGDRPRSAERRRVFRKWGVLINESNYKGRLPSVIVRDPETRAELPTIVADPDAETFGGDRIARQDSNAIMAQAGQLKSALQLVRQLAEQSGVDVSSILDGDGDALSIPAEPAESDEAPSAVATEATTENTDDDEPLPPVGNDGRAKSNPRRAPVKGKAKA